MVRPKQGMYETHAGGSDRQGSEIISHDALPLDRHSRHHQLAMVDAFDGFQLVRKFVKLL